MKNLKQRFLNWDSWTPESQLVTSNWLILFLDTKFALKEGNAVSLLKQLLVAL